MGYRIYVEINAFSEQEAIDMVTIALEDHGIHFTRIVSDNISETKG